MGGIIYFQVTPPDTVGRIEQLTEHPGIEPLEVWRNIVNRNSFVDEILNSWQLLQPIFSGYSQWQRLQMVERAQELIARVEKRNENPKN